MAALRAAAIGRALSLLLVVLDIPLANAAAGGAAACAIERIAELPLIGDLRYMLVGVEINGSPFTMIVDTGAQWTAITPDIVQRLQLPADSWHGGLHRGVAAFSSNVNALTRSFKIGPIELDGRSLAVVPLAVRLAVSPPFAGLLGADFLYRFDLELDLPHRKLTLYPNGGCAAGVPPWAFPFITIPLVKSATNRLNLAASIDGHPLRAIIDTGASASLITRPNALRAGVTAERLEADPAGRGAGVGAQEFAMRRHVFGELLIGSERFKDAALQVGGTAPLGGGDMLLGLDYLGRRRVWISYARRQMFIAAAQAAAEQEGGVGFGK